MATLNNQRVTIIMVVYSGYNGDLIGHVVMTEKNWDFSNEHCYSTNRYDAQCWSFTLEIEGNRMEPADFPAAILEFEPAIPRFLFGLVPVPNILRRTDLSKNMLCLHIRMVYHQFPSKLQFFFGISLLQFPDQSSLPIWDWSLMTLSSPQNMFLFRHSMLSMQPWLVTSTSSTSSTYPIYPLHLFMFNQLNLQYFFKWDPWPSQILTQLFRRHMATGHNLGTLVIHPK